SGGGQSTETIVEVTPPTASQAATTVTITVTSNTTGSVSRVTVPGTTVGSAVNNAIETAEENGTSPVVEIQVDTPARAESIEVTLPTAAVDALARQEDAELKITSGVAEVTLDADALAAAAEQAGRNLTISVIPVASSALSDSQREAVGDAPVYDVSIGSRNTVVSDLGGGRITVAIPYELAEGQTAEGLTVYYLDDEGNLHPCTTTYNAATGMLAFYTGHLSMYAVLYDETAAWVNPFADVAAGDWFYGNVAYACENGLMTGTSATAFDPHGTATRAMVATVLWRMDGSPGVEGMYSDYTDVARGAWYESAIGWAAQNGVLSGYGGGLMGPEDDITREQMAAVLYRYAEYKGYDLSATADLSPFTDAGQISDWAVTPLSWANANGLISGKGAGVLDPGGSAERCQVAAILERFCQAFVD
ncbi:MAG: S-layer homology domain-containing protein, partial [Bacillota bacterium]|nr:S-layer homology domain-containing protein [Bacillota bacterium]